MIIFLIHWKSKMEAIKVIYGTVTRSEKCWSSGTSLCCKTNCGATRRQIYAATHQERSKCGKKWQDAAPRSES